MSDLKYTVIKTKTQYNKYCDTLEKLIEKRQTSGTEQEIELLTLLIEKWDEEHDSFLDLDPVELIKYLMQEHNLKAKDLVKIMEVSKGMVSSILSYEKGLSKESIRKLAEHFNLSQEAFNRPYDKKRLTSRIAA